VLTVIGCIAGGVALAVAVVIGLAISGIRSEGRKRVEGYWRIPPGGDES
jgi:hypothetical protein